MRLVDGRILYDPNLAFQESIQRFEPFTGELIISHLKPDGVFLDIGANIGWFTLIAAQAREKAKIYSFEPNPGAFKALCKNVEANKYRNVTPVHSAVSNHNGTIKLFVKKDHNGMERWDWSSTTLRTEQGYTTANSIDVPETTIDSFFLNKSSNRVDLIKMDIEGGEPAAFKGMKKTLSENPNIVVVSEFSYFDSEEGYGYLKEWEALGFHFYRINEKKKELVPQTMDEVVHTPMAIRVHSSNILLKRN